MEGGVLDSGEDRMTTGQEGWQATRILLIDGGSTTVRSVARLLRARGYLCDTCDVAADGLGIGSVNEYQMVILDVLSPEIDAREVLRRLRDSGCSPPILTLIGAEEVDAESNSLADHGTALLSLPCHQETLTAQIAAILLKARAQARPGLQNGKLRLDPANRMVLAGGQPLQLTSKEYGVLELLLRRKGAPVTKEMFLDHLYGNKQRPGGKIVDVYVCKIRKKIEIAIGDDNCIETVWGGGYLLRNAC